MIVSLFYLNVIHVIYNITIWLVHKHINMFSTTYFRHIIHKKYSESKQIKILLLMNKNKWKSFNAEQQK